jgi:hypothetical protein
MGLFRTIRDWLSEKESHAPHHVRLAALVSEQEFEPGLWPERPLGFICGKVIYATNPRVAEDPIYLTRMVFHLQTLAHARGENLPLPERRLHDLLNTDVSPDFAVPEPVPVEVAGVDGLFLHDVEWRTSDHPDWQWWQPNRGLRRIHLDARGQLRQILPAAPGDPGRYANQPR